MSSENNSDKARGSENLKVDLRGVRSVAPSQLAADLLPHENRWPIVIGLVPALPEPFQSRDISALLSSLFPLEGDYIIVGIAGTGKTQAAAQAVHAGLDAGELELVIWISARSRENILSVLAEAAHAVLNLSQPYPALEEAADLLLEWLSKTSRRWVVVLDDLSNSVDATALWPSGPKGAVIVTSRTRKIAVPERRFRTIELGPFDASEAADYLTQRFEGRPGALYRSGELSAILGYQPLALMLASAYISEQGINCGEYIDRFATSENASEPSQNAIRRTAERAASLAWAAALETRPGTAQALGIFFNLLDANRVPDLILRSVATKSYIARHFPQGRDEFGVLPDDSVADSLSTLLHLGLISSEAMAGASVYRMHPLARFRQIGVRFRQRRAGVAMADAILEVWPQDFYLRSRATLVRSLCANVNALRATMNEYLWDSTGPHPALLQAGRSLMSLGLVGEAITYWTSLEAESEAALGHEDISTVRVRANLANAYKSAGRVQDAIPLLERAVARCSSELGVDHPDTLAAQNNLASCYQETGRLGAAVSLLENTLESRVRVFGGGHPLALNSLNNLATAYEKTGNLSDASALLVRVLENRVMTLGPDHPDTLVTQNNLALVHLQQGKLEQGTQELEAVSTSYEAVLGPSHPRTLACRNSLAATYLACGRASQALVLLERILRESESVLGPDHPDTLTVRNNLAKAYQDVGRLSESIQLLEVNTASCQQVLGLEHPDTLASWNNLAAVFRAAGRNAEALPLLFRSVSARERILGSDHPDTLASRGLLSAAMLEAGDYAAAVELQEQVFSDQLRVLGPDHPDTLTARNNLALAYQRIGRHAEALVLFGETVALRSRVLGVEHPQTLASKSNWAIALWDAGQLADALPLLGDALIVSERTLGLSHPRTLASRTNFALALRDNGDISASVALLEQNLSEARRVFGEGDRTTFLTGLNLAGAYRAAGRLEDSFSLLRQIHQQALGVLGAEDLITHAIEQSLEVPSDTDPQRDL